MANCVCDVALIDGPLALNAPFEIAGAGGVVFFHGIVRPLETGKPIVALDYEAHQDMASHQLQGVAEAAIKQFGLLAVRLHHRIGHVPVGETSLALHVAASHRQAAFEAAKWMVDELKKRVPIWKTPVFRSASVTGREQPVPVTK
jgi:Molybdopterin converting factor, large subunit